MARNPIPRPLHLANEALAFLLEIAALAGLCWWGVRTAPSLGAQLALGIGAPVVLIVVWALFCAPKARVRLPKAPLMVLRTALLLAAALAVFAAGWQVAAIVLAVVILLNAAITVMDRDALINAPLIRAPQINAPLIRAPRSTNADAAAGDIPDQ